MNRSIIKEAKRNLRKQIKKELALVSSESIIQQSKSVHSQLLKNEHFQNARKVAVYMNMPTMEVNTQQIIETCFQMKKHVYLPKCVYEVKDGRKPNHLQMLKIESLAQILRLEPQGKLGLKEPIDGENIMTTGQLDVIIVPGVAFSREKRRLGHGAGFYDEFLSFYSKYFNTKPFLIGVGLEQQLVNQLPTEEHDWVLDCVIIAKNENEPSP